MKTLSILIKSLLVILMVISVIQMFFYSETIEQLIMYWTLLMLSGIGILVYNINPSTK
jgi:hypothetical protein